MNSVEEALFNALRTTPDQWDIRLELLTKLQSRGATDEFATLAAESATYSPPSESALRKVCELCQKAGCADSVAPILTAFLDQNPSSDLAHYLMAKERLGNGDLPGARKHYQSAVALNPDLEDDILAVKLTEVEKATSPTENNDAASATADNAEKKVDSNTHLVHLDGREAVEFEDRAHHTRHLLVGEGGTIRPPKKEKDTSRKMSALAVAVAAHLVIGFILAIIVVNLPSQTPPQIVTNAAAVLDEEPFQKQEIKKQIQRKPVQSAQAQMDVVSAQGMSAVALPDIKTDMTSFDPIGTGDAFGASMTFDAGEDGGMVSFFGSKSTTRKVVFVVDFSISMKDRGKDQLMRKELSKSLNALPGGIDYQCIFFSGPVWFHHQEVNDKNKKDIFVLEEKGGKKWPWISITSTHRKPGWTTDPDEMPPGEFIASTRSNIRKSIEAVQNQRLVGGTDWRWPLYTAMNMRPDTIYFMTDGAGGADDESVAELLAHNRKTARAKINSICLMVLQAEEQLGRLAQATGGEFTLVLEDQTVIRGKELEEYKKDRKK